MCIAALLCFAYDRSVRETELVVRQQTGEYGRQCPHVDINKIYKRFNDNGYWPNCFEEADRCLPLVAAYILCGTDFTPTLSSVTAAYVFDNYHRLTVPLQNAAFVKQLGAERTGSAQVVLNTEECVKFIGLA